MSDPDPGSFRNRFAAGYRFGFDRFQIEAFDAIDRGAHTIVAAPTGSGKTVVAEYAIELMLARGQRAFYTTPIKALSNQKFRDLTDRYGPDEVGLLTGDHSINPDASIVVMTTEVLRNMIYGDGRLDELGMVVIDEVHFLQDAYRGPVWEEVIIQLPEPVRLVCLSATVSNSDELAEWISTVRGPSTAVVETHRPVPLKQRYLVDDLATGEMRSFDTIVRGKPNPAAERLLSARAQPQARSRAGSRGARSRHRSSVATPDRFEVLHYLRSERLLPAVHFVFSRRQCSDAAQACVTAGVRLSTDDERDQLLALLEQRVSSLGDADLSAVGYNEFVAQLSAGVAPHHAGMIPAFKEVVELGFLAGQIKLVYATETLAVGVNMPARSVVIDKLTKYNGDHHEMLSPAQFTQLSGRAGRRGMDTTGTVIVLHSPFVGFDAVAALAAADGFALRSAFRPTYNMAVNLVARYDEARARQFLSLSFAQFQADRNVVQLERQIVRLERRRDEQLDRVAANADEKSVLQSQIVAGALAPAPASSSEPSDEIELGLRRLGTGDVISIDKGTFKGPAAVVATSQRAAGTKVTVITAGASIVKIDPGEWAAPPTVITKIVLPGSFSPHQRKYASEVGQRVKNATLGHHRSQPNVDRAGEPPARSQTQKWPDKARESERLVALAEAERLQREITTKRRRVARRDGALAADLERVLGVLEGFGFVDRASWQLTPAGEMLRKIFHENDLLISRSLNAGVFDGLDAPSLAGLVSVFVYEHRSADDPPPPWFPSADVAERWSRIVQLSDEQASREIALRRSEHRRPDPTMFAAVHGWVAGGGLDVVLEDDISGGDFVRSLRQLTDLLEQIAQAAPSTTTRATARAAAEAVYRDVVADKATELLDTRDPDASTHQHGRSQR